MFKPLQYHGVKLHQLNNGIVDNCQVMRWVHNCNKHMRKTCKFFKNYVPVKPYGAIECFPRK